MNPQEKPLTAVLAGADVTEAVIELAIDVTDGYWPDTRVEWEDAIDRMERGTGYDFGDSMLSPAIAKLRRAIRAHRNENGLP